MKASDKQVGGNHYKDFPIQPGEFCVKNGLKGFQQSIVGRICRYDKPTGKGLEDLEKIKHEVDLIIEWEGWKEEKYWETYVDPIDNYFGNVSDEQLDKDVENAGYTPGLPKLHLCKCGETPFQNWGNGFYWVECPKCHNVGSKSQLQYGAQTHWNEGSINYASVERI